MNNQFDNRSYNFAIIQNISYSVTSSKAKDTDKLYFLIVPVSFSAAVRVLKCAIGLMRYWLNRCYGNSHYLHSHRENN